MFGVQPVGCDLQILLFLTFSLLLVFLTFKNSCLFNTCLMCNRLAVIYECFAYVNTFYVSVWSEMGHCCICSFLLAKQLSMLVYSWWLNLMGASAGLTSRTTKKYNSYASLKVSYFFCEVTTSLYLLVDIQTFLHYLFTCRFQPYFYGYDSSA